MPTSHSPKDNSHWVVPGRPEPLGKGQFLLAIYEDYVESIKKCGAVAVTSQYWHNWSDCIPPLEPLLITD